MKHSSTPFVSWDGILGKAFKRGGIIYFCTPHNTIVKMGLLYFGRAARELTIEERKKAAEFVRDAKALGIKPFTIPQSVYDESGGKIIPYTFIPPPFVRGESQDLILSASSQDNDMPY